MPSGGWKNRKPPVGWKVDPQAASSLGIIGAFLFNEAGGQVAFNAPGADQLGLGGVLSSGTAFAPGLFGPGIACSGTTSNVDFGVAPAMFNISRNFSILTWFRLTAADGAGYGLMSVGNGGWYLRATGDAANVMQFLDSQTAVILNGSSTLVAGTWYQAVLTVDPASTATITLYLNGIQDAQTTNSATYSSSAQHLVIGSEYDSVASEYFKGLIDHTLFANRCWTPAEVQKLYAEPFHWVQTRRRGAVKAGAGTNTTVTPTTLSLSLTTFAPTVLTPRLCTPTTLALTTTKFAPVIKLSVIPATKALTLSTFAPTVVLPKLCTPTTLALTLTKFAPTVSTPRLVTPTTKALSLTLFAPTVSAPRLVTPTTLSLTMTKFAPTVSTPRLCTPTTRALTLSTFAPTIVNPKSAMPTTASLTLTTFVPAVTATASGTFIPGTASLTITRFAPTVLTPRTVTPGTKSLALTTFVPLVRTPRTVTPSTLALTISAYAPTVRTGGTGARQLINGGLINSGLVNGGLVA